MNIIIFGTKGYLSNSLLFDKNKKIKATTTLNNTQINKKVRWNDVSISSSKAVIDEPTKIQLQQPLLPIKRALEKSFIQQQQPLNLREVVV